MKPSQCHLWLRTPTREELQTAFDIVKSYEEDSHLIRRLLKCHQCGQLYFYGFDEEVDYKGGEDAQYRTWIPLESEEAAAPFINQSHNGFVSYLPRLEYSWPSDKESPTIKWIGK